MFSIRFSLVVAMALCLALPSVPASAEMLAPFERPLEAPSAPPRVCEIRQKSWCMYQEDSEITDHQVTDAQDSGVHIWSMRNIYHPKSVLMIIEPDGCRTGFSDEVKSLGFDENVKWHDKIWDQMRIRLMADGSCDLRLLVPLYNRDPLEWAFSVGRLLIAACPDDQCKSIVPTPGDVTDKYRKQFMRSDDRP